MAVAPRLRGVAIGPKVPHLFLSHSAKDKTWVSQLAEDLNLCGVDVWFDAWELRVGDDLHARISDAVEKSRYVAVVVTSHFSESKWIRGEVHQALSREKAEDRTIVLPLLAEDVSAPPVLAAKKFLDFRGDYFGSLAHLAGLVHELPPDAIESEIRGRRPTKVSHCVRLLEDAGWTSRHVVGTRAMDEILKLGGVLRGEVVHFSADQILKSPDISRSLRRYLEALKDLEHCELESKHQAEKVADPLVKAGRASEQRMPPEQIQTKDDERRPPERDKPAYSRQVFIRRARPNEPQEKAIPAQSGIAAALWELGTRATLWSVACSSDGRWIVAGGDDGVVYLWDRATGEEIRSFRGERSLRSDRDGVLSVALSRNNQLIATGNANGSVALWSARSHNEPIEAVQRHDYRAVQAVTFSPDGGAMLSGGKDAMVRVWDIELSRESAAFPVSPGKDIQLFAFSPDATQVVVTSGSNVQLYSVESGAKIRQLEGHRGQIIDIAFSPDGKRVISGGTDKRLRVWDVSRDSPPTVLIGHDNDITAVAISHDGRYALAGNGYEGENLWLWDLDRREELHRFSGHSNRVTHVVFSYDKPEAVTSSYDGTVRVWTLSEFFNTTAG